MRPRHIETHLVERIGWLRAAVLGANDGIISTASLILGVAAAAAAKSDIMLAGVAGLVAGAMYMAAGEYVSVGSQSDTEQADLAKERRSLRKIQTSRRRSWHRFGRPRRGGWSGTRSRATADGQGCACRPCSGRAWLVGDHRGEAHSGGITSATTFSAGAAAPLALVVLSPASLLIPIVSAGSLLFLAVLGFLGAKTGGAAVLTPIIRVTFWGALAMAVTAGIGAIVGTVV